MKKTIKSVLSFALILTMALPVAACGKKGGSGGSGKKEKKKVISESDPYFEVTEREVKLDFDKTKEVESSTLNNCCIVGDTIVANYFVYYKMPADVEKKLEKIDTCDPKAWDEYMKVYNEYYDSGMLLMNKDLEVTGKIKFENSSMTNFFPGPNGEITGIFTEYSQQKCTEENTVVSFSAQGEKLKEIKLDPSIQDLWNVKVYFLDNENMIIPAYGTIYLLDKDGKKLKEIKDEDFTGSLFVQNGKYYSYVQKWNTDYTDMKCSLKEIDLDSFSYKDEKQVEYINEYAVFSGPDGLYRMDSDTIGTFDLFSKDSKELLDWNDVDYNYLDLMPNEVHIFNEDEICFFRTESHFARNKAESESTTYFITLKRAEKNPHAGKSVIEMGSANTPDSEMMDYIVAYNKDPNHKSRIRVHNYSNDIDFSADSYEKNMSNVVNTLYLDMLSASGPDILLDFSGMTQFNTDRILLDLNTMIDGANGLSRDQYFDNVFRAFEDNGKLFQIPVHFNVEGFLGNKDVVGDRSGWTYDEFDQIMSNLPNKMMAFDGETKSGLLYQSLLANLTDFIDYNTKKVEFDGAGFKKLLEICKKYGGDDVSDDFLSSAVSSKMDPGPGMGGYDGDKFENDLIALERVSVANLTGYAEAMQRRKGKVTFIGVPSEKQSGLLAYSGMTLAISAASEHKEEAWDFIRFLFEEEQQTKLTRENYCMPMSKSAFDGNVKAEIASYEEDKKRFKENPEEFYDIDGNDPYTLDMSDNSVQALKDLISKITSKFNEDPAVTAVINEEVPAFFQNQRSADDVCKIIQNKVNTIVNER